MCVLKMCIYYIYIKRERERERHREESKITQLPNVKQWLTAWRQWQRFGKGVSGNSGDGIVRCGWKGLPRWGQRWDKALDCFFITLYTRTIYSAPCGG